MEYADYSLIESDQELAALCESCANGGSVALDTEFIRIRTFYPRLGLIQLGAKGRCYLIDPLKISDWDCFKSLLTDSSLVKIFHSCSEDLLVLYSKLGVIPRPLFDTQLASSFLNEGHGLSYQALVGALKQIQLPKGETRSDWLQRPLRDSQLRYAAQDVAYLPEIHQYQQGALDKAGKASWFAEECGNLTEILAAEASAEYGDYYRNIKGAWQLNRRQLAILRLLAEWREVRARHRNRPRSWIISDQSLMDMARAQPLDAHSLGNIEGLTKGFIRRNGPKILELAAAGAKVPEDELPPRLPGPLNSGEKKQLKKARRFVERKAGEANLPAELLASKRSLISLLHNLRSHRQGKKAVEAVADDSCLPPRLAGWRKSLLLPELFQVLRQSA